jgi:large repetitive protein
MWRFKVAFVVVCTLAAIAVAGGSAADFEADNGPCPETPGNGALLRCPTAYVGQAYEAQIESEDGSGCEPYVWYEIVNSTLPAGLSMSREGLISGVPTGGPGLGRFWVWNHDLIASQGGPSWCTFDDRSEREFSIPVDPGLAIVNQSVKPASVGVPYSETLTAKRVETLNPVTGQDVQAMWSLESGSLPTGVTLSPTGVLSGTPTSEGSYQFVVKAQDGSPFDRETYTLVVRQTVTVRLPFAPGQRPSAEVGARFAKSATATGGTGSYTWSLATGALPAGLVLNAGSGAIAGSPQSAGTFAFSLTATDAEGRVATANGSLTVAPRLTIKTVRLKPARVGRAYRARVVTAGGVQPLRWKVLTGQLPKGIRLDSTLGNLAGTPARAGSVGVTLQVTDGLKVVAKKTLRLVVAG